MRFVMFFGIIGFAVSLFALFTLIPIDLQFWMVPAVMVGGAAILGLMIIWQVCSRAFPPNGGRQPETHDPRQQELPL